MVMITALSSPNWHGCTVYWRARPAGRHASEGREAGGVYIWRSERAAVPVRGRAVWSDCLTDTECRAIALERVTCVRACEEEFGIARCGEKQQRCERFEYVLT